MAHVLQRAKDGFNTRFDWMVGKYVSGVRTVVDRKWLFLLIYAGVVALLAVLFLRLPTGFLPTEDQGSAIVQFRLPAGATQGRTMEVQRQVEHYFAQHEGKNVKVLFSVAGGGGGGTSGQNTGQGFINFVDWADRKGKENSADAITGRASAAFRGLRDAQVFALVPPLFAASASRTASPWSCRISPACRWRSSRRCATSCSPRPMPTRCWLRSA
ncbi:hypothetical protein GCM10020258_04690 [Sphingomonas yabuuchiae]